MVIYKDLRGFGGGKPKFLEKIYRPTSSTWRLSLINSNSGPSGGRSGFIGITDSANCTTCFSTMSVIIHNMQRSIKLDLWRLERDVRYLRRLMGLTSFHMGIQCVEDDEISEANLTYRGVEGETDVLAFPFIEDMEPGKPLPEIADPDLRLLGDLMLGIPYIQKHAQLNREPLEGTLSVMVLHGMCHLIGYDHETKDQWRQMYNKELSILEKFNQKTGYSCKPLLAIGHG